MMIPNFMIIFPWVLITQEIYYIERRRHLEFNIRIEGTSVKRILKPFIEYPLISMRLPKHLNGLKINFFLMVH